MQTPGDTSYETHDPFRPTMPPFDNGIDTASIDWEGWVNDHPMGAILAAAAAGAGVMALMSIAPSHRSTPRSAAESVASASKSTTRDFDTLRDQVSDLARRFMAAVPDQRDVSRRADAASDSMNGAMNGAWKDVRDQASGVGETLRSTWNDVRDQASSMAGRIRPKVADMAGQLRPQVDAAAHLARENPMWVGVAVGAIGALLASRLVGRLDD